MLWNDHTKLKGTHAFLSASKPSWLNKDAESLREAKRNSYAQQIGTILHAYAADCITYREKLRKSDVHGVKLELLRSGIPEYAIDLRRVYGTLMTYVNDAIGFGLDPEIVLYYSSECYGTADAINLDHDILRIHDLKTGVSPVKMDQLMVYAGLFFHEYKLKPEKIKTELRIYQLDEILTYEPDSVEIREVMEDIVEKNRVLMNMNQEVL